ncbi:MAG: hypothetical protein WBL53_03380 [Pseudonocardiaceae bacterium]
MSMPLLPQWLRIVWAVALAGVLLLHVWHAWSRPSQPRWWHIGHIIMALGMMGMYLLGMAHPGLYRVGVVFFAVMTVALATTAVVFRRREHVLNPLWVASAVDMLTMTYMLLPSAAQPAGLRWVFIAYLAWQILAWALGLWDRVPVLQPAPSPLGPVPATRATATTGTVQAVAAATAIPAPSEGRVLGLTAHCTPAIRISLAVMAASMAYMLAVM